MLSAALLADARGARLTLARLSRLSQPRGKEQVGIVVVVQDQQPRADLRILQPFQDEVWQGAGLCIFPAGYLGLPRYFPVRLDEALLASRVHPEHPDEGAVVAQAGGILDGDLGFPWILVSAWPGRWMRRELKLPYSGWPDEGGAGVRAGQSRLQRRLKVIEDRVPSHKVGVSLEWHIGKGIGVDFDLYFLGQEGFK